MIWQVFERDVIGLLKTKNNIYIKNAVYINNKMKILEIFDCTVLFVQSKYKFIQTKKNYSIVFKSNFSRRANITNKIPYPVLSIFYNGQFFQMLLRTSNKTNIQIL